MKWDRVYVTTLFTFSWKKIIEAIDFAKLVVKDISGLYVGGIAASLNPEMLAKETDLVVGRNIIPGLLDRPGILDANEIVIDELTPDYSILDEVSYCYPRGDGYLAYTTKGCTRQCSFCAVPTLEPVYKPRISIKKQIQEVEKAYGPRRNLILMDNNVLGSPNFPEIIAEILEIGFTKDAKLHHRRRFVDFNQGLDCRYIDEEKIRLLSQLPIRPMRIAFDHLGLQEKYENAVRLADKYGIYELSNYLLFNYQDRPEELWERMKINIDLNRELTANIYCFPMKYAPVRGEEAKSRSYIGSHWNRKYLRAIQCIINVTKGVVTTNNPLFFARAFGESLTEYFEILMMPEEYIFHRDHFDENGETERWREQYQNLNREERQEAENLIHNHLFSCNDTTSKAVLEFLKHYQTNYRSEKLCKEVGK